VINIRSSLLTEGEGEGAVVRASKVLEDILEGSVTPYAIWRGDSDAQGTTLLGGYLFKQSCGVS
jgi:hypothetical protein